MNKGWLCPQCNKAHGPHVDTCPGGGGTGVAPPVVLPTVFTIPNQPWREPYTGDPLPRMPGTTCGDKWSSTSIAVDPILMLRN